MPLPGEPIIKLWTLPSIQSFMHLLAHPDFSVAPPLTSP